MVAGTLVAISKNFNQWLVKTSRDLNFGTLERACLLGTARILRYALNALSCRLRLDARLDITSFLKPV